MSIWLARCETSHFSFVCAANDDQEAIAGLIVGLKKHGKQCGLDRNWFDIYERTLEEVDEGVCYRDGSKLK